MDSFAGSELRKFLPLYTGKETNDQPVRKSIGYTNTSDDPEVTSHDVAEETVTPKSVTGTFTILTQASRSSLYQNYSLQP